MGLYLFTKAYTHHWRFSGEQSLEDKAASSRQQQSDMTGNVKTPAARGY